MAGTVGSLCGGRVSVRDFCAREEVSEASFYQWRKRLAGERSNRRRVAKPAFQEVRVTPVAGVLSIEFPGGARLEAPADHLELARAVVRELALAAPADGSGGA